jgi:hypothetical protein
VSRLPLKREANGVGLSYDPKSGDVLVTEGAPGEIEGEDSEWVWSYQAGRLRMVRNYAPEGDAQLVAKYYGSPMQPTAVHMLPLYMQSNVLNGQAQLSAAVNEYEPSYTIEPNSTTAQFTIGLFELGYGNFGYAATALLPIIGILMAMYGLLKKSRQKPRARKKA